MRIAADAGDLNCRELPASTQKDDLDLSENCYSCRCIDVPHAGIDFFRCCRGRKNDPRKRRQLPEIHLQELDGGCWI
jgi:hypothetical protein